MADQNDTNTSAAKDPKDWVTGDEEVTGPQASYLGTLAQQAGEDVDPTTLSKAEASQKIDQLKEKTGRGQGSGDDGDTADERVGKENT